MDVKDFQKKMIVHTRVINDCLNATLTKIGLPFELTNLQVRILLEIYHEGSGTIGNLAERVSIADANISTTCKKLEQKGFVTRNRDKMDERVVRIALTENGYTIIQKIDNVFNEKIATAVAGLTDPSLEEMIYGLEKLHELMRRIV